MRDPHEGCTRETHQAKVIMGESVGFLCMIMSPVLLILGIIIGIPLVLIALIHDLKDKITNPKK